MTADHTMDGGIFDRTLLLPDLIACEKLGIVQREFGSGSKVTGIP